MTLDPRLAGLLVCPRDGSDFTEAEDGALVCVEGHRYPCPGGIPVLLRDDVSQTHAIMERSLREAREPVAPDDEYGGTGIDPDVSDAVSATCGLLYKHLVGSLTAYPIPELRLPSGDGQLFLDVGCHWGRWSIAAGRAGYLPIGLDPSLEGVRAARKVARQLGVDALFVVGDARHLPFRPGSFDVVFSYSVFQHLREQDVQEAVDEIARVLKPGGRSRVQMPNVYGARNLYLQLRERRFREPLKQFDVRYWFPGELRRSFGRIGPTALEVDGFFSLNAQSSDLALMPSRFRAAIRLSDFLRGLARRFPALTLVADSLYVRSTRA
jgi:SAM-dependent methyltransferase